MLAVSAAAAVTLSSLMERLCTDGGCFVAGCELAGLTAGMCDECEEDALTVRTFLPRTTSLSPTYTHSSR